MEKISLAYCVERESYRGSYIGKGEGSHRFLFPYVLLCFYPIFFFLYPYVIRSFYHSIIFPVYISSWYSFVFPSINSSTCIFPFAIHSLYPLTSSFIFPFFLSFIILSFSHYLSLCYFLFLIFYSFLFLPFVTFPANTHSLLS